MSDFYALSGRGEYSQIHGKYSLFLCFVIYNFGLHLLMDKNHNERPENNKKNLVWVVLWHILLGITCPNSFKDFNKIKYIKRKMLGVSFSNV